VRLLQSEVLDDGNTSGVFGVRAVFDQLLPHAEKEYASAPADTQAQKLAALSARAEALALRARTEPVEDDIARLRRKLTQLLPTQSPPPKPPLQVRKAISH